MQNENKGNSQLEKSNQKKLVKEIEKLSAHNHLCLIYSTHEEQFAAVIPFMRIGLERGEKCVYIADDNSATEILDAMRAGGIDVDAAHKNGSLSVITKREAYLRNGYFDPDEMIQFLAESTAQAKSEGYSAFRVTGEMTWMLGGEPGTDRLIEYEAKLNRFFPEHDCLALCQYNRNRFSPETLLDVIHTHPIVVVGSVVCKNFYYVPVEEFLKTGKGNSEEVDRLLTNLLDRENVEEERQGQIKFMESMDKVNRAIQGAQDLDHMMGDVLDVTLSIFDCDRAWLVYPCDLEAATYRVPMERTKPEYSGALAQNSEIPVDAETIEVFRAVRASSGPVTFDATSKPPLPSGVMKYFHVQSQVAIVVYPKVHLPYVFGLHQCSYQRIWTTDEKRLFQEIGRRLSDGLTGVLIFNDLQKSEQEYRNIIETANEGIWTIDKDRKTSFVNQRTLDMLGYTEKEMLEKNIDDFVIPEEMDSHKQQMMGRIEGKVASYERRFLRKDGSIVWVNISATPLLDDTKQFNGSFGMLTDITERKNAEMEIIRVNRALEMVSNINQALVRSTDEISLLNETCRIAAEVGGYRLAWVGFTEQDEEKMVKPIAQAGPGTEYLKSIIVTWKDEEKGRGPTGTAIRTGKTQISHDIAKDPIMSPWRESALKNGLKSSIALPLSNKGKVFGCLTIYAVEADSFSQKEVAILEELSGDLAFGIVDQRDRIEHKDIEEKFITAFNASPDLMSITRLKDGMILEVNDGYTKLLGYERSESVGKTTAELSIWANLADRAKFIAALEKFGEVNDFETSLRRKDGTLLDCIDSAKTFELKGEKCVLSAVHDITDRKHAEMEREQFLRFFNLSTDIMVIADPNGAFKKVNPTSTKILGYSESELLLKPFIDFVHPDDKKPTLDEMARQITIGNSLNFENRYICKDGKVVWLSWHANYNKDEGITYATARDITEQKKREQHITELSEVRSKFIDIISHQLGTPLTAVNWNLEILLSGSFGKLEETQRQFLQATHGASIEITHRIHNLLIAMDIEEGRVAYKNEEVALDSLCAGVVNEMRKKAELKNISFEYSFPANDLIAAHGDGEKIRMAITVMIDNAITYTKDDGKIEMKLLVHDNIARFEVKDTGVGIPQAEQHRIFKRFFRASNAAIMQPNAFGLGLFVAKNFAEQHGGKIGFESKEGEGSTFWLEMPYSATPSANTTSREE